MKSSNTALNRFYVSNTASLYVLYLSLDSVNIQASNLEKTEGELLEFRLVIQV